MIDHDTVLVAFGARLREARKHRGFSQEELAFEAGFDRTYISLLERGKRNPSLATIHQLAETLGISPAELFR